MVPIKVARPARGLSFFSLPYHVLAFPHVVCVCVCPNMKRDTCMRAERKFTSLDVALIRSPVFRCHSNRCPGGRLPVSFYLICAGESDLEAFSLLALRLY